MNRRRQSYIPKLKGLVWAGTNPLLMEGSQPVLVLEATQEDVRHVQTPVLRRAHLPPKNVLFVC